MFLSWLDDLICIQLELDGTLNNTRYYPTLYMHYKLDRAKGNNFSAMPIRKMAQEFIGKLETARLSVLAKK